MLADGDRFMGISEVAAAVAFGKDAVAEALDSLHRGGVLEEAGARNQRLFRLGRRNDLVTLVGSEPDWKRSWAWPIVLPIMAGILEATDLAESHLHGACRRPPAALARVAAPASPVLGS